MVIIKLFQGIVNEVIYIEDPETADNYFKGLVLETELEFKTCEDLKNSDIGIILKEAKDTWHYENSKEEIILREIDKTVENVK